VRCTRSLAGPRNKGVNLNTVPHEHAEAPPLTVVPYILRFKWGRVLMRRTQKPLSSLWKMTRSMTPEISSVAGLRSGLAAFMGGLHFPTEAESGAFRQKHFYHAPAAPQCCGTRPRPTCRITARICATLGGCAETFYRRFFSSSSPDLRRAGLNWLGLIRSRRITCTSESNFLKVHASAYLHAESLGPAAHTAKRSDDCLPRLGQ
jgi:hypothetical protein